MLHEKNPEGYTKLKGGENIIYAELNIMFQTLDSLVQKTGGGGCGISSDIKINPFTDNLAKSGFLDVLCAPETARMPQKPCST